MGSLIAATCSDCGLEESLKLGSGFLDFRESARVPAGCGECHRLVLVNARRPSPWACPTTDCRGQPVLIGELTTEPPAREKDLVFDWLVDNASGTTYVLPRGPHRCPACGGAHLAFEMQGRFD